MPQQPPSDKLPDDLLLVLRKRPEKSYTTFGLARKLSRPPEDIIQALLRLEEWGYKIHTTRKGEISFRSAPDLLTATEMTYGLKTKLIGRRFFAFGKVTSTNEMAAQLAEAGVYDGTVVTAEEQTHGRGRLGRSWYSPPGAGIYVSIILRPKFRAELAPGISIMTALALSETLNEYMLGKVQVKWPNDVLIEGKKVAGILTELSADGPTINQLIVGVGINVNHRAGDFPADIRDHATSIRRASGRNEQRVLLLQRFLARFEKEYSKYEKDGLARSRTRLKAYSSLLGHDVTLVSGTDTITGHAVDIDREGRLVLRTKEGKASIASGEVTVSSAKPRASD